MSALMSGATQTTEPPLRFNAFIKMTCQIMHGLWFWHSTRPEPTVHPAPFTSTQAETWLRRLAASDLEQVSLSKVVHSHLAKSDNSVWWSFYSNAAGWNAFHLRSTFLSATHQEECYFLP